MGPICAYEGMVSIAAGGPPFILGLPGPSKPAVGTLHAAQAREQSHGIG
jgi:hypothetical protein